MKTSLLSGLLILSSALIVSCATVAPKELVVARASYQRALNGPAAQLALVDLHKAETALQEAEHAFAEEPNEQQTRDLSYIAGRRAEIAEAIATQEMNKRNKAKADENFVKVQGEALTESREQLAQQKDSERSAQEHTALLAADQRATAAESKVVEVERKNAEIQESLAKLAAVSEEERGLVITLSGSVLFASNKSELLPAAQARLGEVAQALVSGSKGRGIIIEGHTDSSGTIANNRGLARRRAEAVRDFLVSHGIAATTISVTGVGPDRPLADNGTAEGRANNRRVEIIIAPKMALK